MLVPDSTLDKLHDVGNSCQPCLHIRVIWGAFKNYHFLKLVDSSSIASDLIIWVRNQVVAFFKKLSRILMCILRENH